MRPRLRCPSSRTLASVGNTGKPSSRRILPGAVNWASSAQRQYATAESASASSALAALRLPADYVPPTQPPSARKPDARKSQLLRTYTSLLRSTPLTLFFQHNNLTAVEWAAVRRELRAALGRVPLPPSVPSPEGAAATPPAVDIATDIQLQVLRTRIFDVALKVVEFFDPATVKTPPKVRTYTHDLSKAAYKAVKGATARDAPPLPVNTTYAQLAPLMVGPLVAVTFPTVSPVHLAAVLSVLAPQAPAFPAPTRRRFPGFHEPNVQSGLQKLLLVGGRVEGRIMDSEGVKWVGGIQGGLDGLRAQLVHLLQSAGLGLSTALEGAGKSLWLTMESRKMDLEEPEKKDGKEKKPEA